MLISDLWVKAFFRAIRLILFELDELDELDELHINSWRQIFSYYLELYCRQVPTRYSRLLLSLSTDE